MPVLHKATNVSCNQKMMRKVVVVFMVLIGLLIGIVLFLSIKQPLVVKTLLGEGRLLGKPVAAKVFTNGVLNTAIEVYKTDNYLLLYDTTPAEMKDVVCIHLKGSYIGTPSGSSNLDFVKYCGLLFQSVPGGRFVSYEDGAKRAQPFNPQLQYSGGSIRFLVSPDARNFRCDSVRVEL